jgi:hypothetical protein
MTDNRVSAILTAKDRQDVMNAIATIKEKLPFLIDISLEERRSLPRMGDKSRAFVSKALEVAIQNPDILPRSFDIEEMRKDAELFESLYGIWQSMIQLCELIDDTKLAVGSEAYVAALLVYNYVKINRKDMGLDDVLDDLAKRFARRSNPASEAES